MKDAALAYIGRGYAVFPCMHRDKRPATPNGLHDAVTDAEGVERLWGNRFGLNIGIATGEASGIFVVDVDGEEGEASLAQLVEAHGALPATLESTTGKGRHLIFRWPGKLVRSSTSKVAPKIDIRGEGGYIVAPPSVHPGDPKKGIPPGRVYRWVNEDVAVADAPDWLVQLAMKERERPMPASYDDTGSSSSSERWSQDEVEQMLQALDPDMVYQDWVNVGMALHAGGYSFAVWDNWSRGGDKYQGGGMFRKWLGFKPGGGITMGTLVDMAKLAGWRPQPTERAALDPTNVNGVDISGLLKQRAKLPAQPKFDPETGEVLEDECPIPAISIPKSVGVLGFDPLQLDGTIGETVRWITASAVKPQPELALMNTLAALGAVFGRRYASPLNTRSNIYIVGIASTGSGKDQSRRAIKTLLTASGLDRFIGGDSVVSGQGLLYGLKAQPSQILHLDEFGMLMQAITDQKGAHYMRAVGKVLTELYSSSSSIYHGGTYADAQKDPVVIQAPNLCIYGTSTLEKYAEAINKSAIASGELNRFIVLPVTRERPERRREVASSTPSQPLIERWEAYKTVPQKGLQSADHANQPVIPHTVYWIGQEDRVHEMGLFEDRMLDVHEADGTGPLWNRYRENVIKIAMIFAIARSHLASVIEAADLDLAEMIVRASIDYMRSVALNHMADSQHEKDSQEVLKMLHSAGGRMGRSDLFRRLRRMNKRTLDDVLTGLVEGGLIQSEQEPSGGGRPKAVYVIA